MRVFHLYAGNLYGGVEKLLGDLARGEAHCPDMQLCVGLCFPGRLSQELAATKISLHMLGEMRVRLPWTVHRTRDALRRLLSEAPGYEAIITHSTWAHSVFAPVVREFPRTALIFWAHDTPLRLSLLDRLAARSPPDCVISHSRFTMRTLPLLFPNTPIELLYHPLLPPEPFDRAAVRRSMRRELECPEDAVVIAMAARLERWKGHEQLLQVLARLKSTNWRAWIGGGPQRKFEKTYFAALKSKAARLNLLDRIRFLGQRSDVPRVLAAADIHCQPNTGPEPFGITFIEALQAGIPAVSTRLGAVPEIIDETCGILKEPGDISGLAEAIDHLIQNPETRRAMGANGPAKAASLCDYPVQLSKLQALVDRIIRSRAD